MFLQLQKNEKGSRDPFITMVYYKRIFHLALPIMVENVLQSLIGVIDTYLVAQLGLVAISGVGLATNILAIYQAVFIAVGAVIAAGIARNLETAKSFVPSALGLTVLLGLGFALISLLGGRDLLLLLGASRAVAQTGTLYLFWVGGTSLTLGLMITLSAMLRVFGKVKTPMVVSFLVNILNVCLSAVGVFGFGWGIFGVALGTVLARAVGVSILWCQLPRDLRLLRFKFDKTLFFQALPAAGERLMMRLGDVVVMGFIAGLGTAVLGGYAIGEVLTQFNYLPAMSIAAATLILTAQYQESPRDLKQLLKETYLISLVLMLLISGGVLVASPWLIQLYSQDLSAYEAGRQVIWASFIGTPVTVGTLIMTAFWQGMGKASRPFYATAVGMWGIRVGCSLCLLIFCKIGLWSILLATIADNAFRSLYLTYLSIIEIRSLSGDKNQ